jgi:hypothetical protein
MSVVVVMVVVDQQLLLLHLCVCLPAIWITLIRPNVSTCQGPSLTDVSGRPSLPSVELTPQGSSASAFVRTVWGA